jgi:hypothetical protein
MRTKALLAAAAFAAGLAASMAQNVYSLNVVGYYNITVPPNSFALIANQLNTTNNTLNNLLPNVPDFTPVFKWTGTRYQQAQFDPGAGGWDPNLTLEPGEGVWIKNITSQPMTVTFVGEVLQGSLTNPVPAGFSIKSPMIPVTGTLSQHGVPGDQFDAVYKWTGAGWRSSSYDTDAGGWDPDLSISVGEAFFLKRARAGQWVRNFTVQ